MYVSRLANKGNKVLCATYTKDIKKAKEVLDNLLNLPYSLKSSRPFTGL